MFFSNPDVLLASEDHQGYNLKETLVLLPQCHLCFLLDGLQFRSVRGKQHQHKQKLDFDQDLDWCFCKTFTPLFA